jgi:hypothetical protein
MSNHLGARVPNHPPDLRLQILLNPGRQSRHYLLGLAAAARRAALPCLTLELGPIWERASATDGRQALEAIRAQIARLARTHRITHTLGYVFNGTHDLGLSAGNTRTLWDDLGVRHLLLWTDHPEWATQGCALDDPLRSLLGAPSRVHVLKSTSAAHEAGAALGWPNTLPLDMAEDYDSVRPVDEPPIHDAVAIVGDAAAPHPVTLPYLTLDDPDPAEIDAAMRPHAERTWHKVVGHDHDPLLASWLDRKQAAPETSFWNLSRTLDNHAQSLAWLSADPRRWYSAVQALRRMVAWRRNFWLAWLGRRADLGLYGSASAPLGIPQTAEAANWVPYNQQASIYARGRVAININAAHDEEGLTHKPFQIAASAVPCIHHAVAGLDACFQPGHEVVTFRRGPELLHAVRSFADDRRRSMGEAMRARAMTSHTWEVRLGAMLAPGHADAPARPASAA